MAEVQVRATAMSGQEVDVMLNGEDTVALLRQKVSEALGVGKWQLRLIYEGTVVNDGGIMKELVGDAVACDVMALVVEAPLVKERSKVLRQYFAMRVRRRHEELLSKHEEAILNGEVAFDFLGDNMLELLLSNWPADFIERPMTLLLAGGAPVNLPSKDGSTPLLTACSRGLSRAANLLLQHGADPHQKLANGDDALMSALKFFEACYEVNARGREEDLELGQICCILRAANIKKLGSLRPLEEARLKLSQAAIELALLAPAGVSLCQKMILKKSALEPATAEAFGEHLWAGWPQAFFTFALEVPEVAHDWDKDFSYARHRILAYKLGKYTSPQVKCRQPNEPLYFSDEGSVYSYYCCCPFCCPSFYSSSLETDSFVSAYEIRKDQNQKWKSSKENSRQSRRAPFASSSKRISRSSRMARKLPGSYRGFQVKQQEHPKSASKLQILKRELAFDRYAL